VYGTVQGTIGLQLIWKRNNLDRSLGLVLINATLHSRLIEDSTGKYVKNRSIDKLNVGDKK
jgi:propanediol utilization protein